MRRPLSLRQLKQSKVCCLQVREYQAHHIEPPGTTVTTTKAELITFFETMYRMRRMEIAADMLYKSKLIRGFCHL